MSISLYPSIYAWEDLPLAHRHAARGKRGKEPASAPGLPPGRWGAISLEFR